MFTGYKVGASNLEWDIVTGDETRIYCYDSKTRQQLTVWVFQDEPKPTKEACKKSASQRMIASFFNKTGHMATVSIQRNLTINENSQQPPHHFVFYLRVTYKLDTVELRGTVEEVSNTDGVDDPSYKCYTRIEVDSLNDRHTSRRLTLAGPDNQMAPFGCFLPPTRHPDGTASVWADGVANSKKPCYKIDVEKKYLVSSQAGRIDKLEKQTFIEAQIYIEIVLAANSKKIDIYPLERFSHSKIFPPKASQSSGRRGGDFNRKRSVDEGGFSDRVGLTFVEMLSQSAAYFRTVSKMGSLSSKKCT
ncbi:hypothetical protein EVAR_31101_1 [Eumeta japonica]|uniref:Uncharacterized protein n=1 Tax=Eumeta variegata TaxID=151549 RepID=A0A4C1VE74_EUMVA|nr:hypothetical protein EVAR_31101_1 [Eumeta japonica]